MSPLTLWHPNRPKPARLSILLCLTPDDFSRQWGTPGSQRVKDKKQHLPYYNIQAVRRRQVGGGGGGGDSHIKRGGMLVRNFKLNP